MDLHSHVLPGVDDGAADIEESLEILRVAVHNGVAGIVATPHFFVGGYVPSKKVVIEKVMELNEAAAAESLPIKVYPGSECYMDYNLVDMVRQGSVQTINDGGKYLLVEFPRMECPSHAQEVFFEIQMEGITPILAHPERNLVISKNPNILKAFIEKGVLTQMNVGSLTGFYGTSVMEVSKILISHRMIHFIATDSHNSRTAEAMGLSKGYEVLEELLDQEEISYMRQLPKRILNGETINVPTPLEYRPKKQSFWDRLFRR